MPTTSDHYQTSPTRRRRATTCPPGNVASRTSARAADPAPTVSLSPEVYPPGPAVPQSDTVVSADGHVILRADQIETYQGAVFHRSSARVSTCGYCGVVVDTAVETPVVVRSPVPGSSSTTTRHFCGSCAEQRTWTCYQCDTLVSDRIRATYAPADDNEDEPLCPSCVAPTSSSLFGRMLNYSNKDIGNVAPKDPSGMLYGWEVEVHLLNGESTNRAIAELHRLVGPGYYVTKPDGSVENGFEIVTRPDSMAVHREEWCRIFEALKQSEFLMRNLRSWEAPRQCCGIHCHIDKDALSALQLGKLATWINHPNNRSFIEKVAGRGSGSYTSFSDSVRVSDGRRLKQKTSDPERYVALNVQSKTAEMRIFRGTLQPRLFFKNMDFVEASVEWTGLSSCSARHVADVSQFARFVYDRRERFPFLYDKLVEWKVEPAQSK